MELRQMEAFAAVADAKSFSMAAERLYISQSTVSSHIRNLEKELGRSLLTRSTKSVRLTPDGIIFLRYVKRILETEEAARAALNAPSETILRLGASTIPSGYLLPKLLSDYRSVHPSVYFDILQEDSSDILEKVSDGSILLGAVGKKEPSAELTYLPFCSDRLVLIMPSNGHYLSLYRQKTEIRRLLKEPIILREEGSGTLKASGRFLDSLNIRYEDLTVAARINDLESIKQMVISGMGISILSSCVVDDIRKSGQVLVCPLHTEISRNFYLVYARHGNLSGALKDFIRYASGYYRTSSGFAV
jgi:DNA-binding transcriptional LysR family regulator